MFRGVPTNQTAKTSGGPRELRAEGPSEGSHVAHTGDGTPLTQPPASALTCGSLTTALGLSAVFSLWNQTQSVPVSPDPGAQPTGSAVHAAFLTAPPVTSKTRCPGLEGVTPVCSADTPVTQRREGPTAPAPPNIRLQHPWSDVV
ncbi:unnamed protein product [Rangifer tarandus platyrhynchus]|uniref:Uncharacterized protein n=1 Tax=Rangifer tarandus platyrhynchus TaxID=3082113 RepID=A0ACB1MJT1_RANTA